MSGKKKVLVIGLDGATWDLLKPWADEGKLPTIKKLMDGGVWGELQSTVPFLTPPAWTSLFTGVNPGKHNIYDFLTRDKQTYLPKLSSVDIRGPRRMLKLAACRSARLDLSG